MKLIIFACLIAFASAGLAPLTAYSSPLAYSNVAPLSYSGLYNAPLAYNSPLAYNTPLSYNAPLGYNSPLLRSSLAYQPAVAPLAYSAAPLYRSPYIRSYPYAF